MKKKPFNKAIMKFTIVLLIMSSMISNVSADSIASSTLATGTTKLITDITTWIVGIAITLTALVCIYLLIRRGIGDEQDRKKWDDRIKITLTSGIGATVASSLVNIIASYFTS